MKIVVVDCMANQCFHMDYYLNTDYILGMDFDMTDQSFHIDYYLDTDYIVGMGIDCFLDFGIAKA